MKQANSVFTIVFMLIWAIVINSSIMLESVYADDQSKNQFLKCILGLNAFEREMKKHKLGLSPNKILDLPLPLPLTIA